MPRMQARPRSQRARRHHRLLVHPSSAPELVLGLLGAHEMVYRVAVARERRSQLALIRLRHRLLRPLLALRAHEPNLPVDHPYPRAANRREVKRGRLLGGLLRVLCTVGTVGEGALGEGPGDALHGGAGAVAEGGGAVLLGDGRGRVLGEELRGVRLRLQLREQQRRAPPALDLHRPLLLDALLLLVALAQRAPRAQRLLPDLVHALLVLGRESREGLQLRLLEPVVVVGRAEERLHERVVAHLLRVERRRRRVVVVTRHRRVLRVLAQPTTARREPRLHRMHRRRPVMPPERTPHRLPPHGPAHPCLAGARGPRAKRVL
mmetsp:Transcript_7087/g.16578  ORF Transcript_7087/g.16578 Transcript_7087/m.16578 type:complete len:320 (-) Transcript_7087:1273-2232(-)